MPVNQAGSVRHGVDHLRRTPAAVPGCWRGPCVTLSCPHPPAHPCSWYMTWFAHDVPALPQIARLFDLFLASHPLMPLYLAAVAIKASLGSERVCV